MKNPSAISAVLLGVIFGNQALAASLYKDNAAYQWFTQSDRFFHQVDFIFSPLLSKNYGVDYRITYSLGESALDVQVSYLSTTWKSVSTSPSGTDLASSPPGTGNAIDLPNSQINLRRNDSDSWSEVILDLGYSYRGRLVPISAKNWMQSARVSAGFIKLKDEVRGLSYSGPSFDTEFSLWYLLGPKVLIGPTLSYRFGWANIDGVAVSNLTRIPLVSFNAAMGTVFKF